MTRTPLLAALSLFFAALLAGCDSRGTPTGLAITDAEPSLLRTVQHFTSVTPLVETAVAGCTGEEVIFVGEIRQALTIVTDPATGTDLHISDQIEIHEVGTGSITGAKYVFNEVERVNFNTPSLPAPNSTFTQHVTARDITQGSLDNRLFSIDFHVTITGQGVAKTTVDNVTITCTG
jgi:hypothetical protein